LTRKILITLFAIASILSFEAGFAAAEAPAVLGLKDQARVVDGWLKVRLDTVLPELMRREKFDMWLVVCEEYNEDPVYLTLVPFEDLSARRLSMLVFYDRGEGQAIEKVTVSRYSIGDLYKSAWDPAKQPDQWQCLAQVIKDRHPKRIGIDESETFAFGDGLTATLKQRLVRVMGKEYESRLQSAERLAVGWLERRIHEELETYPHIVAIAHAIIAQAFSRDVITPGATTAEDVSWWMRERIRGLGLAVWFHPDISIQRPKASPYKGDVIHRGDLLHCDMGITYLRLNTDTQQHAYVLKEGEVDAPQGLKDALAQGNKLQDILLSEFREGRTGNEVLSAALAKAKSEGLKPSVYTHPLGYHGHAAGPTIGLWDQQNGVPGAGDYPLFYDTVYSIELNAKANAPEWDNQEVTIALEQDAAFTRKGTYFLDERQTKFFLIK
jgi:hypothetical protein